MHQLCSEVSNAWSSSGGDAGGLLDMNIEQWLETGTQPFRILLFPAAEMTSGIHFISRIPITTHHSPEGAGNVWACRGMPHTRHPYPPTADGTHRCTTHAVHRPRNHLLFHFLNENMRPLLLLSFPSQAPPTSFISQAPPTEHSSITQTSPQPSISG